MTEEEVLQEAEAIHEANQRLLRRTRDRSEELERAARESVRIVEQALRQLRTGR